MLVRNPMQRLRRLTRSKLRELIVIVAILITTMIIMLFLPFLVDDPVLDYRFPLRNSTTFATVPEPNSSSSHVKIHLYASEKAYQSYAKKRKEKVGSNPENVKPWTGGTYYYDYFLPSFSCPHTVQRIGRMGDGGKWTCGFDLYEKSNVSSGQGQSRKKELQEPCIIYSFGVAGDSSYEAEFLQRTNCEIFAFDASVDGMGPEISKDETKMHFEKTFIGHDNKEEKTGNRKTLKTIMNENGHTWIDFVKMDIEGDEYYVLNQIMNDFNILPFGQLQLEIHGDDEGKLFPVFYKLWERLEQWGLRSFKIELNPWPCVRHSFFTNYKPTLMEYSFINILGEHRVVK